MSVITAGISARPLYPTGNGLISMGAGIFIHDMTPDLARQWAEVLTNFAEDNA